MVVAEGRLRWETNDPVVTPEGKSQKKKEEKDPSIHYL